MVVEYLARPIVDHGCAETDRYEILSGCLYCGVCKKPTPRSSLLLVYWDFNDLLFDTPIIEEDRPWIFSCDFTDIYCQDCVEVVREFPVPG